MWAVYNRTAYAAGSSWTRDKWGNHRWLVAVRATFEVGARGSLKLADEQPPPALEPIYASEPGLSHLRWDSDLLYEKPGTDVIAEAHAHAPGGRPSAAICVRLRVGPIDKELAVYGTQSYYAAGVGVGTTSPVPYTKRPIVYEWAYGGTEVGPDGRTPLALDARNPIGKGFVSDPRRPTESFAPAIRYPSGDPAKTGPAGFGAIDAAWMPRRRLAGTYDADWFAHKRPLLPDDYDELYGSSAPGDQRTVRPLQGGEVVELVHLTPEGICRFELPRIHLRCATYFGRRCEPRGATLVTILLQPEEQRAVMVWQSALPVRAADVEYLDYTRVEEVAAP